ncbi:DUF262 domain-containing protein [uncultured Thiodictyon sp.]|uniref:DUF262 domain-containing protein n=1 Tax=uncultured Thiodictyon sp. TaxID=1846217 RepID=UPI0025D72885|nr:DUF262 domain-containing protein [uncultured Thiodictyon sp.]
MNTTSFAGLRNLKIEQIEIPVIQRDYALGRTDTGTERIRRGFLDALLKALEPNVQHRQPLDFIYGEIKDNKLIPLDGQQRLTTLFLLHWYLAARLGLIADEWRTLPALTYLTRTSSEDFCCQLSDCPPPFAEPLAEQENPNDNLAVWIRDQSWFRRAWERDPTIVGMLVSLDDLHGRIKAWDKPQLQGAWDRLTDPEDPAIGFDFLPITDIGSTDRQYIRMNARGKALTEFEHFKARFEKTLALCSDPDRKRFAKGVDSNWTDLLWPLRNSGKSSELDTVIDDEFLRLFRYLGALVVWKFKLGAKAAPDRAAELQVWAESLFGQSDIQGERRIFLFDALDTLYRIFKDKDRSAIEAEFAQWFVGDTHQPGRVAIFKSPNLLVECVTHFGESTQSDRFPLVQQLMFYALLRGWMTQRPLDAQCLRVLRNLLLAPDAYLVQEKAADYYLPGIEYLSDHGLPGSGAPIPEALAKAFSTRQVKEEVEKQTLKSGKAALAPSIERLEDHPLLQGCLFAFDLCSLNLPVANTFFDIFPPASPRTFARLLTGALLTKGDYSCPVDDRFQFGSATQSNLWRYMLTNDSSKIRQPLDALLVDVAARTGDIAAHLEGIISDWRACNQSDFDWRWYFIRYPSMRNGENSRFYSPSGELGFLLCRYRERLSSFDDPYLKALHEASCIEGVAYWSGWEATLSRYISWLRSKNQKNILRSDPAGWVVVPPADPAQQSAFANVCRTHSLQLHTNGEWLLVVPQNAALDKDTADRITLGARLLFDLHPLY